jgi:hypothetical protein
VSDDWQVNVARKLLALGHVFQKQGYSYECARCGATGTAVVTDRSSAGAGMAQEVTLTGTIDRKRCGE